MEIAQHRAVRGQQLVAGAEHRPAVGVAGEQALVDRHLQGVPRLAVVHGDLFQDHLPLARHLLGGEGEARDAVGLDGQRLGPAVGGEVEVVGGAVVAGEGVVDAAQGLGDAVDLARPVARRALEHHVLEEVGDAAVAGGLVAGAGAVEEGRGHHRRLAVGEQADGETVAQALQPDAAGERLEARRRLQHGMMMGTPADESLTHRLLPE